MADESGEHEERVRLERWMAPLGDVRAGEGPDVLPVRLAIDAGAVAGASPFTPLALASGSFARPAPHESVDLIERVDDGELPVL